MSFTTLIFACVSGKTYACLALCKCTVRVGVHLSVESSDNRFHSGQILSPRMLPKIDAGFILVPVFNVVS